MKKLIFTILLSAGVASSIPGFAVPLSVGTTVNDITLVDIEGNSVSLYSYLDQGYTVLIDISATWCGPCWSYDQTHVSEDLYEHYGPDGTEIPKKLMVLFIEGDPSTNSADLHGTGANTQGDWVTGKEYPIVDAPDWGPVTHFLDPSSTSVSYPTFLLICPDRTVIWNSEGFSPSMTEAFFVGQMGNCAPTGIDKVMKVSSLSVYPNPVNNQLSLDVAVTEKTDVTIQITNIIGQEVYMQESTLQAGPQTKVINTSALQNGIYILSLTSSDGTTIQKKFVKR